MVMILVQLAYGGSNILMKVALEKGLNQFVFVVYRHLIAMILLGPFAYVVDRKQRPSLSLPVMIKIFLLALLGTTIHLNVYCAGLAYISATVASALSNVIPSFTFLMAVLLSMEKVNITSGRGCAKVLGTAICIGGSLVFTFWKGRHLYKSFEDRPLISIHRRKGHAKEDWIKGSALILTSHIAWSAWLILLSSFLALFFGRNPTLWKLEWNVQLLTIIYCGIVVSGSVYYLQTWCISNKGPVFAAMFSPLLLVIVGTFSAIAFAETFHLGSLVGALVIMLEPYCVLWGKWEDEQPEEGIAIISDGDATLVERTLPIRVS